MKLLALLLTCLPCFAQFPYSGVAWSTKSSGFAPVAGSFMWYSVLNNVTNDAGTSPPSNGDTVKGWGDLSANGFHLIQLAASKQFGYHTLAGTQALPPNGSPYIEMTNASPGGLTNTFSNTTFSQPNTYFFVLNGFSRPGTVAFLNGKSDQNQQIIWGAPPGGFDLFAGSSMNTGNKFPSGNAWQVYTFQFNGASSLVRSNSVAISFASGTTVGAGGLKGITLGAYFNFSTGAAGFGICELVGYNSALSSGDMLKEEEYLANKYGITGIP